MAVRVSSIRQGACYSNGEFGAKWNVWQVVEITVDSCEDEALCERDIIRFRILVGKNRRKYLTMTREDFASKVRYEVELVETTWHRIK